MNLSRLSLVFTTMKKLSVILVAAALCVFAWTIKSPIHVQGNTAPVATQPADQKSDSALFEEAVEIIKKYETLHKPKHWPLVGYGHKVLPGEKFDRNRALTESEADALLRKDLRKLCGIFRDFGPDSLLLGVLAYNIGSGATMRSSVVKKLRAGDRDIESAYLAHSRYKGKVHNQIRQRRIEEFETLYLDGNDMMDIEEINAELTAQSDGIEAYPQKIWIADISGPPSSFVSKNNLNSKSVLN